MQSITNVKSSPDGPADAFNHAHLIEVCIDLIYILSQKSNSHPHRHVELMNNPSQKVKFKRKLSLHNIAYHPGRCRNMHKLIEEGAEPKGSNCAKKRSSAKILSVENLQVGDSTGCNAPNPLQKGL